MANHPNFHFRRFSNDDPLERTTKRNAYPILWSCHWAGGYGYDDVMGVAICDAGLSPECWTNALGNVITCTDVARASNISANEARSLMEALCVNPQRDPVGDHSFCLAGGRTDLPQEMFS